MFATSTPSAYQATALVIGLGIDFIYFLIFYSAFYIGGWIASMVLRPVIRIIFYD